MQVAVSILDCVDRVKGVKILNGTKVNYIHVDVMDGKFVPNVQLNKREEIEAINEVADVQLDVHLMVDDPESYIEQFDDMKIKYVTIHVEIEKDIRRVMQLIKDKGYKVGLSLKPGTDVSRLEPYLDMVDLILIMSVEPGIGGQKFMDSTHDRVKEVKRLIEKTGRNIVIEVDGGVNKEVVTRLVDVDIAVVGSYITKSDNYGERVDSLFAKNA